MTEADWLNSTDPQVMLSFLRDSGKLSQCKARLFMVACCRHIWPLLTDKRSRQAVEVAEQNVEGLATREKVAAALSAAMAASDTAGELASEARSAYEQDSSTVLAYAAADGSNHAAYSAYVLLMDTVDSPYAVLSASAAINASAEAADAAAAVAYATGGKDPPAEDVARAARVAEEIAQVALLRCLFGPSPFRSLPPVARSVLHWHGGLIQHLAEAAYENRLLPSGHLDLQRLAVLADAMEEAGADTELVEHLRGPGPHVRGCAVVDRLLGRL